MSMAIKVSKVGHRGDPGIFGDILGGITGAVGGFISGGPLGAVGGALRGSGLVRQRTPQPGTGFVGGGPSILPPAPGAGGMLQRLQRRMGGVTGQPVLRMGGGPSRMPVPTQPTGMPPARMNGMMYPTSGPPPGPGYRPNKSGYWRISPAGTPFYVEPGMMWVKRRRRNPANARATDRAISRIEGAKRYSKKLSRITVKKACPN